MSDYVGQVLLILLLIMINGFLAMSEIALVTVRPSRLRLKEKNGDVKASRTLRLVRDSSRFLSTIQVGITFAGFLASASAAVSLSMPLAGVLKAVPNRLISEQAQGLAVLVITVLISYLSLVFGELVPKQFALRSTDRIAVAVSRPVEIFGQLVYPLVRVLSWSTNVVLKLFGVSREQADQRITEEDIRLMIHEHKTLEDDEKQMIEGVFDFGDAIVREIMVPRTDVVYVNDTATVEEVLELIHETGFSRFPVTSGTVDDIIGIINAKDLIPYVDKENRKNTISQLARPAYFVPESKKAIDLMKELQHESIHMAIVVDEYGGTAGLVTMEILVEQIVGSIQDEHDFEEEEIRKVDDSTVVIQGDADIRLVNDVLKMGIPENGDYETIAGFVLDTLECIPEPGVQFDYKNWTITVSEIEGRRITEVKVTTR